MTGKTKAFALVVALAAVTLAFTSCAQAVTYLSLSPESDPYCFDINFGTQGPGEYSLWIDDPGDPDSPWASIHAASFFASESNVVIVPVCISAKGRKIGDKTILKFTEQMPPARNITYSYGVCVRKEEWIEETETEEDPCSPAIPKVDAFSASLLESERTVKAGEPVKYKLEVSSDSTAKILIEKVDGPQMQLSNTTLYLPGSKVVDIDMTAPAQAGNYTFSLLVKKDGCTQPSCQKTVEGILYVEKDTVTKEGFVVSLSGSNTDVKGTNPAVFYLTIRNYDPQQTFKVSASTDEGLSASLDMDTVTIGKGNARVVTITAVPKSGEAKLHTIKAIVEDGNGMKQTADATLTVHEETSGGEEPQGNTNGQGTQNGQNTNTVPVAGNNGTDEPDIVPDEPVVIPPLFIAVIVVVAVVVVAGFYLYKKMKVESDEGTPYFEPAYGSG